MLHDWRGRIRTHTDVSETNIYTKGHRHFRNWDESARWQYIRMVGCLIHYCMQTQKTSKIDSNVYEGAIPLNPILKCLLNIRFDSTQLQGHNFDSTVITIHDSNSNPIPTLPSTLVLLTAYGITEFWVLNKLEFDPTFARIDLSTTLRQFGPSRLNDVKAR